MKLLNLQKKYEGHYLSYYIAEYLNNDNNIKLYEFTSRNKNLTIDNFGKYVPCGVGIVPFSINKDKVLLQREFRMACNQWVYNFPTGLIDEGETPESAIKRELYEETGVELVQIDKVLPISYASAPITDEAIILMIGRAQGEIKESSSADEEIIAKWYTKEEIEELFNNNTLMSIRTQIILYNWISK